MHCVWNICQIIGLQIGMCALNIWLMFKYLPSFSNCMFVLSLIKDFVNINSDIWQIHMHTM